MRVAYQPEIVGRTESNVEHVYGLCTRERDRQCGGGGRETRIRRIRVEWKLKKIDDNREEKRVDKFMGMGVFVEDFCCGRLRVNYDIRVEVTWNSIPFGMESIIFPVLHEICSCNKN